MLTKEQILKADDIKTEIVNVPEWSGEVCIKMMTGFERDKFEQSVIHDGNTDLANIRAKFCSIVIVDESGKRIFNDADVIELGRKSGKALSRVFDAAQKLNGMTKDDFEELEKNSGTTLPDSSISS
jgi:hypothetical protein